MPIRTLIEAGDQLSFCSVRCTSNAASSASLAVWNAAEKESPTIRKTKPLWDSMDSFKISLWRAKSAGISLGCSCASLVLPSISVKRKVTVPDGVAIIEGPSADKINVFIIGQIGFPGSYGSLRRANGGQRTIR